MQKSGESRSKVKVKLSHSQVEVRLRSFHSQVGLPNSRVWSSHSQVHSQVEVIS
jgi:hypothetical protein